ncbi:hypothetical protein F5887DRAFT_1074254 [Amanita rubescens]|nr:hypothetical protein F5887DRAFT_1074254 [Amanita rubescens]
MGASTSPAPTGPDHSEPTSMTSSCSVAEGGSALRLTERDIDPPSCFGVDSPPEWSSEKLPLHERLPVEIIQHIFILRAQMHEEVYLPFQRACAPPQQIVSHVCSDWRRIALNTGELWNNVMMVKLDEETLEMARIWLGRAKVMSVVLKLCLLKTVIPDLAHALETLCRPLHLKRIEMMLSSCQLAELSKIPDDALPHLTETRVVLHAHKVTPTLRLESFVSRVNFLLCASGPCLDLLRFGCLPMGKMRHLDIRCVEMTPTQFLNVLLRATSLESCRAVWYWEWEGEEPLVTMENVILPNMKTLILEFHRQRRRSIVFDAIGRSLVFPNLQKLSLLYRGFSSTTLPTMSERFNFSRLEELELRKTGSTTASEVLKCAPQLRCCAFSKNITFDEDAMDGLSTGRLGRRLVSIKTNNECDPGRMFTMVETRRKSAKKEDEGTHQMITAFQNLNFRAVGNHSEFINYADAFRELGVGVVINGTPKEKSNPSRISDSEIPDMWSKFYQPNVY